jgi:hypothetical protein
MIIDLLTDKSLMNESNFAEGYNVFTGAVSQNHPDNSKYGEVHSSRSGLVFSIDCSKDSFDDSSASRELNISGKDS